MLFKNPQWRWAGGMVRYFLLFILFCQCREKAATQAVAVPDADSSAKPVASVPGSVRDTVSRSKNSYPFELSADGGQFSIQAFVDGEPLYPKYYKFFKKYGYEGNGPCWEGHVRQILEKADSGLLAHLRFDVEGGAFLAYADSRQTQQEFVDVLSPIFANWTLYPCG